MDEENNKPDSLSTIYHSLQCHLIINKYEHNLEKQVKQSRNLLASNCKKLTKMRLGNKPNATREITEEEILNLFKRKNIFTASQDALQQTL